MIPKIIHQIWIGSEIPKVFLTASERLKYLHPDYKYILWTENNIPKELINQEVIDDIYRNNGNLSVISDCIRYEILARYGGIYSDFDIIFFKSINDLIKEKTEVIIEENNITLNNCFIAVEQNHPFIHNVINGLRSNYFGNKDTESILVSGGVFYYSNAVQKWTDDLYIAPREYFIPLSQYCKWNDFNKKIHQISNDKCYGLHFWGNKGINVICNQMEMTLNYLRDKGL